MNKDVNKIIYETYNGLKMKCDTKNGKKKETIFTSYDVNTIINWTITALYDGAVKRCKLKIEQYYNDDKQEYCKIIAKYTEYGFNYEKSRDVIYTIENWCNDWGNFINTNKTFTNNKIKIVKEENEVF